MFKKIYKHANKVWNPTWSRYKSGKTWSLRQKDSVAEHWFLSRDFHVVKCEFCKTITVIIICWEIFKMSSSYVHILCFKVSEVKLYFSVEIFEILLDKSKDKELLF